MKLQEIMLTGSEEEQLIVAKFKGDHIYEDCDTCLVVDSTMQYYLDELGRRIRHKLADKLGLEEPLHKEIAGEDFVDSESNTALEDEIHEALTYLSGGSLGPPGEDFVDRDLGLQERDCDR